MALVNKIESKCISALQWISGIISKPSRWTTADSDAFQPYRKVLKGGIMLLFLVWPFKTYSKSSPGLNETIK